MTKQVNSRSIIRLLFAATVIMLFFCSEASAWWNEQWQYRKKITFDLAAGGSEIQEDLSDMTVLVRLHSGNFNFPEAMDNGEDIRFVKANDQDLLKFHIEKYDLIDELALVWIRVPRMSPNSQSFIWMYYGNKAAAAASNPQDSFNINTTAVYHFAEIEGLPQDQSPNQNHPAQFSGGLGLPAAIGNGIALNGAGDRILIPVTPTMVFNTGFTFSSWIRLNAPQTDAYLFFGEEDSKNPARLVVGIDGFTAYSSIAWGKNKQVLAKASTPLTQGTWHYLTITATPNQRLAIYLDGIESHAVDLPRDIPGMTGNIIIGDDSAGKHALVAELDEISIANTARSSGWIQALHTGQGPLSQLVSFGPEEIGGGGGMPVFYLATIMKNITMDGWVIVCILGLLGAVSWFTFLVKAAFLWMIRRDNKNFLKDFNQAKTFKALKESARSYENSGLLRVFNIGLEALTVCLSNPEMCFMSESTSGNPKPIKRKRLNIKGMNAFKAGLERGYIEETQRLNGWLTILTMAITGGPFLGLLGTVWGVMNTFAAMAEAGEANIMAIAPGVASALSTTVFGLIVAIPALFSYNYLTSKIKDMTAGLTIFIDQYTVKVDQFYGGTHETSNL